MAFNTLSGIVKAPSQLGPIKSDTNGGGAAQFTLSGSLEGDGTLIENIPRIVANSSRYNIITVGSDENSLVGETEMTFDGTTFKIGDQEDPKFTVDQEGIVVNGSTSNLVFDGQNLKVGTKEDPEFIFDGSQLRIGGENGKFSFDGEALNIQELAIGSLSPRDNDPVGKMLAYDSATGRIGIAPADEGLGGMFSDIREQDTSQRRLGLYNRLSRHNNDTMFNGSVVFNHTIVTEEYYEISINDYYVNINTNVGPVELVLPVANTLAGGHTYIIKDRFGGANLNNVIIKTQGSDEIDGENSVVLKSPYASIQLFCDGFDNYSIF